MLTESQLHRLIKESVKNVLNEYKKSIKSSKLQDIFKQHGGIYKDIYQRGKHCRNYVSTDIHNMTDDCILAVMTYEQIQKLKKDHIVDNWRWSDNYGLDKWVKEKGIPMQRGDTVETLKLQDGMYLVYLKKNAEFEHSGREGGFKDYWEKVSARHRRQGGDGKNRFIPLTNKSLAAREVRTNPYAWAPEGGWNKNERSNIINGIRNGNYYRTGNPFGNNNKPKLP